MDAIQVLFTDWLQQQENSDYVALITDKDGVPLWRSASDAEQSFPIGAEQPLCSTLTPVVDQLEKWSVIGSLRSVSCDASIRGHPIRIAQLHYAPAIHTTVILTEKIIRKGNRRRSLSGASAAAQMMGGSVPWIRNHLPPRTQMIQSLRHLLRQPMKMLLAPLLGLDQNAVSLEDDGTTDEDM